MLAYYPLQSSSWDFQFCERHWASLKRERKTRHTLQFQEKNHVVSCCCDQDDLLSFYGQYHNNGYYLVSILSTRLVVAPVIYSTTHSSSSFPELITERLL